MKIPETPAVPSSGLDVLLKKTLADDLPEEIERRLEQRLESFLAARRSQAQLGWGFRSWPGRMNGVAGELHGRVRRPVLALSSALIMVSGLLLHVTGGRSVFADSMARLNTTVSLYHALHGVSFMACSAAGTDQDGEAATYAIRWSAREGTRGQLYRTGKAPLTFRGGPEGIDAPFQPVAEMLAPPADLADRMYRKWVPTGTEGRPQSAAVVLRFQSEDGRASYEVVADRATFRPQLFRKSELGIRDPRAKAGPGFSARCTWERAAGTATGEGG